LVVGAGIVGVSTALFLQRDGHRVTLIDPREPGTGTSFGNAGGIVVTSCAPIAMPGIWARLPGMLLDPTGPLVLRPRYLPRMLPWLARFVTASRPRRVAAISAALAALGARSAAAWQDLARQGGLDSLMRPVGWLKVYERESAFRASAAERAILARHGKRFEVLGADELRQLEPNLAPHFRHAVLQPDCHALINPHRMVAGLAADFISRGGRQLRDAAAAVEVSPSGRPGVRGARGLQEADAVVLAAGAWSKAMARALGVGPPLDSERGYHLMLPPADKGLSRPTVNVDDGFVLCPMEEGIRLTSGVEFAGLEAPANFTRVRGLLPLAARMLPGLDTREQSAWLGFRPSMPDGLPVIGPAPAVPHVYCAFGHGHLGMTHGPATGRAIADLIAGRDPGLDLAPFRATR
jgi:D-amino-acid dehydrogenase